MPLPQLGLPQSPNLGSVNEFEGAPPGVKLRGIGDSGVTRSAIFDSALKSASELKPVVGKDYTLSLSNPKYEGPAEYDRTHQRNAVLRGESMTRKMTGEWSLTHNVTGEKLASRRTTIANVPYLTDDGVFMINGNGYPQANQQRQRSGVYHRLKGNGDHEAHINPIHQKGLQHRVLLEKDTGVFKMKVANSEIPIYPVLRLLGASHEDISDAWGREVADTNRGKGNPKVIDKLYTKLVNSKEPGPVDERLRADAVREAIEAMEMDPEVNEHTLGKPHARLNKDLYLDSTKKLLAISRGQAEIDDRDHPAFQLVHGPEDLIAEKFRANRGAMIKMLWKASLSKNLDHIKPAIFDPAVRGAITDSGLGTASEGINSGMLLDQRYRITKLGEGAISSSDAIPDESRAVQPGQYGFIDPVATPESNSIGAEGRIATNVLKGSDNRLYQKFRDVRNGKMMWRSPQDLLKSTIAFAGELASGEPMVKAIANGREDIVPRSQVDYELPHLEEGFAPLSNLVPLKSAMKPHRIAMAQRMLSQALPLENAEAQLVTMTNDKGVSFADALGEHFGAVKSKVGGTVQKIDPHQIQVKGDDGQVHKYPLYERLPYNRKTALEQTPSVAHGQRVEPGQLLARSNFTNDKGRVALGLNVRVAYMPWKGTGYEDAVAISESAAKRYRSHHMYQHEVEDADNMIRGRDAYASLFPGKVSKEKLKNYDDDGVVKVGTKINQDDLLVLAAKTQEPGPKRLHAGRAASWSDASEAWEHHDEGVVTDVERTKRGVKVVVRSTSATKVGDKFSGLHGDKGVASEIIPDDQMPHDKDGNPVDMIVSDLGVTGRVNPSQVFEGWLGKIAQKTGKPYELKDFDTTRDWTNFVHEEAKKHGVEKNEDLFDPTRGGAAIPGVLTGQRYIMKLHHEAESKLQGRGTGGYSADGSPSRGGFSGCFVGSQRVLTADGDLRISQICERKLGSQVLTFCTERQEWVYRPVTDWFVYRAKVEDIVSIYVVGPCRFKDTRHKKFMRYHYAAINVTKNHVMILADGRRIEAGGLKPGDQLATRGLIPTADQMAFMLGSLLGDASATDNGFSVMHSIKQTEYVNWKRRILSGLMPNVIDTDKDMCPPDWTGDRQLAQFRVLYLGNLEMSAELRKLCYSGPGEKKTITKEWLDQLTDLSVAAWILDDGSIGNRAKKKGGISLSGSIATMGFDPSGVAMLADWLSARYGRHCLHMKKCNAISLSADMCRRLIDVIAQNVPWEAIPKSKRYLRKTVRKMQKDNAPKQHSVVSTYGVVPMAIIDITPYKPEKSVADLNVYDITVEGTHTYCAGPALVSNSKKVGVLGTHALLSHGATHTLQDAILGRGQQHPEFWRQFASGKSNLSAGLPTVHRKFVAMLRASGLNVTQEGGNVNIMAMTNKDVDHYTGGRTLENAEFLDAKKGYKPVKGGLFDEAMHGADGTDWAAMNLTEPMLNPVMEEPARKLLNMTEKDFRETLAGNKELNGKHGPAAIQQALADIDIDHEMTRARDEIASGKVTKRDAAVRRLSYLKSAKKLDIHPGDWVLNKVPVLPPAFRPISMMAGSKTPLISDANLLYRDLHDANKALETFKGQSSDLAEERLAVYDAMKAVTGLGEPIQAKTADKQAKGLLKQLLGCYDEETEILTQRGWLRFRHLTDADVVATLNPKTCFFEWQKPTARQAYDYNGEMVQIRSGKRANRKAAATRIDLLLTPNHRNFVRWRSKLTESDKALKLGWRIEEAWRTAANTNRGWMRVAAAGWRGHRNLPEFAKNMDPRVFASLVGWYVAEGWIVFDKRYDGQGKVLRKDPTRVGLSQERVRNADKCAEIERLLLASGLNVSALNRKPQKTSGYARTTLARQWSIASPDLADWLLHNCGHGSNNKSLSRFILDWDTDLLEAVLAGYLGGDGDARDLLAVPANTPGKRTHTRRSHLTDKFHAFVTTSEALRNCLYELACKLGLTVRPLEPGTPRSDRLPQFPGSVGGHQFAAMEGTADKKFVPYCGKVYCCTVPNGLLFVRRNGIPVFSGNSAPKFGYMQRKLLGSQTDMVGRGVIVPDQNLSIDEIGIPESAAWEIFKPVLMRDMVRGGVDRMKAAKEIMGKSEFAKKFLLDSMEKRPIMMDRAPVLHRYSVMAYRPKLVPGDAVRIPPLVTAGHGADFDGDAVQFHVPASEEAAQEMLDKMLPSKNLLAVRNFKVHQLPTKEFGGGLYRGSTGRSEKPPRHFANLKAVRAAFSRGEIHADDQVTVAAQ